MIHQFDVRFRADDTEVEGQGSLLVPCSPAEKTISHDIRRLVYKMQQDNPTAQFDGMIYRGCSERD